MRALANKGLVVVLIRSPFLMLCSIRFKILFPLVFLIGPLWADDTGVGPNLLNGNFESGYPSYNPWGGVDDSGCLHVWPGKQLAVGDNGQVEATPFSPSMAVADLNGDGLPDLVVADARGFFWFFPNAGKPGAPAFTHGEVMPIWLGTSLQEEEGDVMANAPEDRQGKRPGQEENRDVVPRIQLVDFTGDHKFGIVAGNYAGQLYFLNNQGSATQPDFRMPQDRSLIEVPTRSDGLLWCNYLAPFLYDWSGAGRLDLTMGDGTYSANSIYLFTNLGSNNHPAYNEQHRLKVIPGMGREDLTPQVVDWNNDGKPDILTGERTGAISVYLNQALHKTDPPVFDQDKPLQIVFENTDATGAARGRKPPRQKVEAKSKIGVGPMLTACVADFKRNNLFDLLVSNTEGRLFYAANTGTPGAPQFGSLVPLKGVYPYSKIILPTTWEIPRFRPYGVPYELLECTNAGLEPGFKPPPGFAGTGALKFSIVDPHAVYFKDRYVPPFPPDDIEHVGRTIHYNDTKDITLQVETNYVFSCWARVNGAISNFSWRLEGSQDISPTESRPVVYRGPAMDVGSDWTRINEILRIPSARGGKPGEKGDFSLDLQWLGDGTLYLDDISLKKAR